VDLGPVAVLGVVLDPVHILNEGEGTVQSGRGQSKLRLN
jgi:hypothetical protein